MTCGDQKKAKYQFMMESGRLDSNSDGHTQSLSGSKRMILTIQFAD